jgi:tetratricopeptide (TPR) repeat protein
MSCDNYRDAIQELADGTLGPIRRAELQVHLDGCARCRALAADLMRIRDVAGSLDRLQAPDTVWLQVAGRLRQEGRIAPAQPAVMRTPRRHIAALALAAALVLAVGASIFVLWPRPSAPASPSNQAAQPAAPAGGNAAAADPVQSFVDEMKIAEQHYQNAIAKLEEAAKADLDPETAAIVQKNLKTIDQAIAESRNALQMDPQSAPARDSLFDALRRKVGVLQDTIALMNEIRKGNSAVAGQISEGVNKS